MTLSSNLIVVLGITLMAVCLAMLLGIACDVSGLETDKPIPPESTPPPDPPLPSPSRQPLPFTVITNEQIRIDHVVGVKLTPQQATRADGEQYLTTVLSILTLTNTPTVDRLFQISVPTSQVTFTYDVPADQPGYVLVSGLRDDHIIKQCRQLNCWVATAEVHLHSRNELH